MIPKGNTICFNAFRASKKHSHFDNILSLTPPNPTYPAPPTDPAPTSLGEVGGGGGWVA